MISPSQSNDFSSHWMVGTLECIVVRQDDSSLEMDLGHCVSQSARIKTWRWWCLKSNPHSQSTRIWQNSPLWQVRFDGRCVSWWALQLQYVPTMRQSHATRNLVTDREREIIGFAVRSSPRPCRTSAMFEFPLIDRGISSCWSESQSKKLPSIKGSSRPRFGYLGI